MNRLGLSNVTTESLRQIPPPPLALSIGHFSTYFRITQLKDWTVSPSDPLGALHGRREFLRTSILPSESWGFSMTLSLEVPVLIPTKSSDTPVSFGSQLTNRWKGSIWGMGLVRWRGERRGSNAKHEYMCG